MDGGERRPALAALHDRGFLAPSPKAQPWDWRHERVGWGLVLPDNLQLDARQRCTAIDAAEPLQRLLVDRAGSPVLRWNAEAGNGYLYRYDASGGRRRLALVSPPTGGYLFVTTDTGTGTITNDDTATYSIDSASISEGGNLVFTVSLSNPVDVATTLDVSFADVFMDPVFVSYRKKVIAPKSVAQKTYVDAIRKNDIVFGIGPAGTGKTYLAMAMAVAAITAKEVERIILTRPAVEAGEKLGFLPGDLAAPSWPATVLGRRGCHR